ncbi:MAG: RHS repeat-associated core domain-containing protein, partial [Clostridia bacterium]|nr:RHS repeat-associated core domain-containing protein [Clostridia bacterium]
PVYDYYSNPLRYCGEYYDSESGLTYLRGRYYSSELRRFITEDPAKDGMNWYAYCGNNPVMFVDPWGLEIQLDKDYANELITMMKNQEGVANRVKLVDDGITVCMDDTFDINNASYGEKLIYDLIQKKDVINISFGDDNYADILTNNIKLTKNEVPLLTFRGDGTSTELTMSTPWIRMAHEMIHIWDTLNGYMTVESSWSFVNHSFVDEFGNMVTVLNDRYAELLCIGVDGYIKDYLTVNGGYVPYYKPIAVNNKGYITENLIRKENGLNERATHSYPLTSTIYSGDIEVMLYNIF